MNKRKLAELWDANVSRANELIKTKVNRVYCKLFAVSEISILYTETMTMFLCGVDYGSV